uniref:Uncharacterized protein n=1 Tax=Anguilla anguilla TaxID=7936 RepID=A0A0E9V3C7_ANGAN
MHQGFFCGGRLAHLLPADIELQTAVAQRSVKAV